MNCISFHPRALLVAAPLVVVLWAATDLRWGIAVATAVVVYDVLSFAGALGAARR
ncbi:MAG TPA: hypothetical protein VKE51_10135 [Vicinamibacterales bacterium]|nr:hypothetical protein [Vicinamibacterales bacterium]